MINVTPEGIILMFLLAFHIWCVVYS
ncbi:TMhelix containing protein [Caenorhabditis elegans]|uniref:TMhelix containing protein n=2 Tax=Caenorhabditis TaxID=6237 RepID=A0A2K5ATU3_CAEEL|nr:TMhelix containing protein [Caenorhabditis elegans]SPC47544.1 TMhelix containing protein [Caenorhabditis elegans]|eukprot:NP_001348749.1 Uncharacterized protein CELE_H38K22.9 [Caenorhabditis elegans]